MGQVRWVRVAIVIAVVAVGSALVAMRLLPASHTPPTDAMREAARVLASSSATPAAPATPAPVPVASPETKREQLYSGAYAMRGIPYKWGAKGPDQFDCSGFTKAAYKAIGISLPDGSFNQAKSEKPLTSAADLTAGDLLFYRWRGADNVTHVTLYAGDGWVIGTGSPGQVPEVSVYPLGDELRIKGAVITYRHITLSDE